MRRSASSTRAPRSRPSRSSASARRAASRPPRPSSAGTAVSSHASPPNSSTSKPKRSSRSRAPPAPAARRRQLDEQRHQQPLALQAAGRQPLHHALEQHALVRDVLVDDGDALVVHRDDERVAKLPERNHRARSPPCSRGLQADGSSGRGPAVAACSRHESAGRGAPSARTQRLAQPSTRQHTRQATIVRGSAETTARGASAVRRAGPGRARPRRRGGRLRARATARGTGPPPSWDARSRRRRRAASR